jgi:hypothetical protein
MEKANLEYIEKITPQLNQRKDRLNRVYLACPWRGRVDLQ